MSKQEALQSQEREASKNKEGCQSGKERGKEDMSKGNSEMSNLERERCQSQHPHYCLVPPQYSEMGGIL